MVKNYQISNNIIFSVNDDGSITRFATISESGEICRIGESIKQPVTKPVWGYWVAIVLFVVATIIAFVLYISMKERYDSQYSQNRTLRSQYENAAGRISKLENRVSTLNQEKESAEDALSTLKSQVGNAYPLIISEIEIANSTEVEISKPIMGIQYIVAIRCILNRELGIMGYRLVPRPLKLNGLNLTDQ